MKTFFLLSFLSIIAISKPIWALSVDSQTRISSFFEDFDKNPKQVMNSLPRKYDQNGFLIQKTNPNFSIDDIQTRRFIDFKKEMRKKRFKSLNLENNNDVIFSESDLGNNPEDLFLESHIKKASELSVSPFTKGKVTTEPWSGDYWSSYRVGIAARYADDSYPRNNEWKPYEDFFYKIFQLAYDSSKRLDNLSPAEKYDLLVKDEGRSLTNWSFEESSKYVEDGKIETWMGLCHGWAPAAYLTPIPSRPVSFKLESGKKLTFFPDDIKALTTLLWANARTHSAYVGGRCNDKKPEKDPETGRIISSLCWDVNPMAWHLIITNRVGADKSSFIMDATWDYEVWNQPIESYKITYFNPETRKISDEMEKVMISYDQFSKDKFKQYRSQKTKNIVGVMMDVTWVMENSASHSSEPRHEVRTGEYIYDLEIDETDQIVGGEWYQNAHPDFLWSPDMNAVALAPIEYRQQLEWDGNSLPDSQINSAAGISSKQGFPLNSIVSVLLQKATR